MQNCIQHHRLPAQTFEAACSSNNSSRRAEDGMHSVRKAVMYPHERAQLAMLVRALAVRFLQDHFGPDGDADSDDEKNALKIAKSEVRDVLKMITKDELQSLPGDNKKDDDNKKGDDRKKDDDNKKDEGKKGRKKKKPDQAGSAAAEEAAAWIKRRKQ